ncbi:hypothetical protein Tco_0622644 [Tanacetum coccineum]
MRMKGAGMRGRVYRGVLEQPCGILVIFSRCVCSADRLFSCVVQDIINRDIQTGSKLVERVEWSHDLDVVTCSNACMVSFGKVLVSRENATLYSKRLILYGNKAGISLVCAGVRGRYCASNNFSSLDNMNARGWSWDGSYLEFPMILRNAMDDGDIQKFLRLRNQCLNAVGAQECL